MKHMREHHKKQLLAMMFMEIFVSMLIGAQLAQTSKPTLIQTPHLSHLEEFSIPAAYLRPKSMG